MIFVKKLLVGFGEESLEESLLKNSFLSSCTI